MSELEGIDYGLTIQAPWAQAIIWGPKRIENRDWRPPGKVVGERIAISTSKSVDEESFRALQAGTDILGGAPWSEYHDWIIEQAEVHDVPATVGYRHHPGHIIGTVRVVAILDDTRGRTTIAPPAGCRSEDRWCGLTSNEAASDDWFAGPVGWLLDDPQPLDDPVPVRGMPAVWNVDEQIEEAA